MVSGSREWGRILGRLRGRHGWSQMDLARYLKHLAERLGVRRVASATAKSIKRSVERWEAGGRPDERYWLLLAHAYATTSDGEADLGPGSDFEQLMHAFELMGVPPHGLDDLREMVSSAVTTGSRAFLAYISPDLQRRLSWVLQHPDRLDRETVAQLQQAITRLRYQRGGAMPPVRLLLAGAPVAEAVRRLRHGCQPQRVREGLCTVAVQVLTFAGSLSFDLRDPDSMQAYYLDADEAGGELRDGWLEAFSLSSRSMITLHGRGDAEAALDLAERACARAADGSSRIVRARSHAILAEMAAATWDARRSERELGLARFHADADGDDPAMAFFNETRAAGLDGLRTHIHGYDGACHIRLGRWQQAQWVLAQAASGLPAAGADRQRAIILADLALTYAKLGDMHMAAFLLGQAITLTATAGGTVPTQRIYEVRREFDPSQDATLLRELNERLHAAALLV